MLRWIRLSMAIAGLLTVIVNLGLTPLLPSERGFAVVAASSIFLWRQSLSALAAVFLILAAAEMLFDSGGTNRWRAGAALLAVIGSTALVGQEWGQMFIVRTLALETPAALLQIDQQPGMSAYDAGALVAISLFTLGWLALALAEILTTDRKLPPTIVFIAFFLVPLLTPLSHNPLIRGAIAATLGIGWIWWGLERYRLKTSRQAPA